MSSNVDRQTIESVVRKVLLEVESKHLPQTCAPCDEKEPVGNNGIFQTADTAVKAARSAFAKWGEAPLESRQVVIAAIRQTCISNAQVLAQMVCDETKLGRVDCKTNKNILVAEKTPGIEHIRQIVYSGDDGLTLIERAPFGVIGSITPITNPTATIINNAISVLSGGNAMVFNVHPAAQKVSIYTIQLLNQAIISAGGPPNLLTAIAQPTIESAQQLMVHPGVDLLLVTGGPAVVEVAMKSGRRAICAGPGNPPVVVDETAVLGQAGRDIVRGASFDNNLPCTGEKEVFVVEEVAEALKESMRANHGYEVPQEALPGLERVIFEELPPPGKPGRINPRWIGQNASHILQEAGLRVDESVRTAFVEVPATHPLVWTEQMMPVVPIVRVRNVHEGIELAHQAEHGFKHTAVMHSLNVSALSKMGRVMDTALFVKNAPSYAGLGYGGEGHTSFSIGTRTGEGMTTCLTFTRERRCSLVDYLRIV